MKRYLKKSQVLREGFESGLRDALRIINETLLTEADDDGIKTLTEDMPIIVVYSTNPKDKNNRLRVVNYCDASTVTNMRKNYISAYFTQVSEDPRFFQIVNGTCKDVMNLLKVTLADLQSNYEDYVSTHNVRAKRNKSALGKKRSY